MKIEYAVVSEQGLREDMEDRHCLIATFGRKQDQLFAGVFDGHGGTYAAHIASTEIPRQFSVFLHAGFSVRRSFVASFEKASYDIIQAASWSGACATALFIRGKSVFFANAGDCALVAMRNRRLQMLTNPHRVGNPIEEERIRKCGGHISDGYVHVGDNGLNPLRSIGDAEFKNVGVIATPECGVIRITKPISLLLGTDGLFDFVDMLEIQRIISAGKQPRVIGERLQEAVERARPLDNYTFLVFSFIP